MPEMSIMPQPYEAEDRRGAEVRLEQYEEYHRRRVRRCHQDVPEVADSHVPPGEVLGEERDEEYLARVRRLEGKKPEIEPALSAHHRMRRDQEKHQQGQGDGVAGHHDRCPAQEAHVGGREHDEHHGGRAYPDKLARRQGSRPIEGMHGENAQQRKHERHDQQRPFGSQRPEGAGQDMPAHKDTMGSISTRTALPAHGPCQVNTAGAAPCGGIWGMTVWDAAMTFPASSKAVATTFTL